MAYFLNSLDPVIIPIWGNLAIHWYGMMIALGLAITLWGIHRTLVRQNILRESLFIPLVTTLILAGIIGGKALHCIESCLTFNACFELGGFSILGSVTACIVALIVFARFYQLNTWRIADACAVWGPLAQAFGRLGCLCAGCCHGCPSTGFLSIMYTHANSLADIMRVPLCPIQLYSALALAGIFVLLWTMQHNMSLKPGSLILTYAILACSERFMIDFWRADAVWYSSWPWKIFSHAQWISILVLCILVLTVGSMFLLKTRYKNT